MKCKYCKNAKNLRTFDPHDLTCFPFCLFACKNTLNKALTLLWELVKISTFSQKILPHKQGYINSKPLDICCVMMNNIKRMFILWCGSETTCTRYISLSAVLLCWYLLQVSWSTIEQANSLLLFPLFCHLNNKNTKLLRHKRHTEDNHRF